MFETIARPYRMKLGLQLFAGDGGGDGSGSGGDEGEGSGAGGGDKTFTQAEVDAMIGQRLPRAEKAAQKALAKDLGYDSVEAMQTALKKPEPSNKKKDDNDNDKDELVDVEALVEEKLKAKQKEQDDRTFKRLLTSEVKVLASELGFADWEDAHALADLTKVIEDDKGNLTGVKEALEELLKKKPHLGKQRPGSGSFGAVVPNSQEQRKKSQEAMINLAKSRGVAGGQATHDPWANK